MALGTLLAACSPTGAAGDPTPTPTPTTSAQPPATTPQAAGKLLRAYLTETRDPGTDSRGRLEGSAARAVHDAQRRFTEAPAPSLAAEFAIPRIKGYPKWFAAGAVRPGMTGDVAIFVQNRRGAPWRVHHLAYLTHPMPELTRDAEGYVSAAEPGDVAARQADALQRAIGQPAAPAPPADGAPADPAASLTAALRQNLRLFTDHAWTARYQTATRGRSFALRTTDGGTVVWYVLTHDFRASNGTGRFEITLSDEAARMLRSTVVRRAFTWQARYQSVAHVQADGGEQVLGIALPGWTAMTGG